MLTFPRVALVELFPQGDQAIIDPRKLTDYVLSSEHDDGKHKAALFRELLGITADRVDLLINGLRQAAIDADVQPGRLDQYGQRYVADFDLIGTAGRALVRPVSLLPSGQTLPRLVTCYIR